MADTVTLYDHRNKPIKRQQLDQELAAPTLSGVRNYWQDVVSTGLTPYRLASLLQNAAEGDAGDYLTLAEEMEERDPHYRCEMGKRRLAVSGLPVVVESASDDPGDIMIADEVRRLVKFPGFRGLIKDLLDANGKGYSVAEIIWQRGQRWTPARYEWRDPRFFRFDRLARRNLRLIDPVNISEGIELAPFKFIVHLPHLKTGLPIRGGIARVAAWSYLCKNYTIKDWLAFAEIFGMPLRLGKYGPGAKVEDVKVLKMAVANLGSDAAAVIPESMQIDFIEAAKSTGGDTLFMRLADWLDVQISRAILGQSATTSGTPGKLGSDEAQSQVRDDIRDDDALQLAETINRDLIRPFVDLNFGPQKDYPELLLRAVENDDLTVLTSALEKLVPLGLRVEQSVVRDKLNIPDPAEDGELLAPAAAPGAAAGLAAQSIPAENRALNAQTTATAEADPVELITRQALETAAIAPLLLPIEKLLEESASLEEFRDSLLSITSAMNISEMAATMQRAMVLADQSGRFDQMDRI
jgi:phage gp29-like protein